MPTAAQPAGEAAAALELLPVKGRASRTGYDRDQFGPAWKDVDYNGCDQRNDVLAQANRDGGAAGERLERRT
jgi:cytochrome c551/c552